MSIFDPTSPPFVRVRTYADDNPPAVLAAEFYNPTQDALAKLYGALVGLSGAIATEEFDDENNVTRVLGDQFGRSHEITQSTNVTSGVIAADTEGAHGVWAATLITPATVTRFAIQDAPANVGARDFLFSARVKCTVNLANLNVAGNGGIFFGLFPLGTGGPYFIAGSDGPNWIAVVNGVSTDTGVAYNNGWFWLGIARFGGNTNFYIQTYPGAVALVAGAADTNTYNGGATRGLSMLTRNTVDGTEQLMVDTLARWIDR